MFFFGPPALRVATPFLGRGDKRGKSKSEIVVAERKPWGRVVSWTPVLDSKNVVEGGERTL